MCSVQHADIHVWCTHCGCVRRCVIDVLSPSLPPSLQSQATVLKEVVAVADYAAQYEDELTFRAGEKIQITLESESDHRPLPLPMRTPRIIITRVN